MALFSECMRSCAQIVLDTADIVREGGFAGESLSRTRLLPLPSDHATRNRGLSRRTEALLPKILPEAPDLQLRLAQYVRFQSLRTSQIAVCNRFHEIEQRRHGGC